jgi:hypothetical protein
MSRTKVDSPEKSREERQVSYHNQSTTLNEIDTELFIHETRCLIFLF